MKRMLSLLVFITLLLGLSGCDFFESTNCSDIGLLEGLKDVTIKEGESIDIMRGVSLSEDCNVSDSYEIQASVYLGNNEDERLLDHEYILPGKYYIEYFVIDRDDNDRIVYDESVILTVLPDEVYPSGSYYLGDLNNDAINEFYGAAEDFLLRSLFGGIPVYRNGSNMVTSNRVVPLLDDYNSVYHYGFDRGTLTKDDTEVLFLNGYIGTEGEYTYRKAVSSIYDHFYPYSSNYSVQHEYIDKIQGSLYDIVPSEHNSGYWFVESMAKGLPTNDSNSDKSSEWYIDVKRDLEWFYNEIETLYPINLTDHTIDANDFVNSWKYAIENELFYAVSGGADFASQRVKNVECYLDGDCTLNDIGIEVQGSKIKLTFEEDKTLHDLLYFLTNSNLAPIHLEIAEYFDQNDMEYGESLNHLAYSGEFYIESVVSDDYLHLRKNPMYEIDPLYQVTGFMYNAIDDAMQVFEKFEEGYLDESHLPNASYSDYKDSAFLYNLYGSSTYSLFLNRTGTNENLKEYIPDSEYEPNILLYNRHFVEALYFGINRQHIADELVPGASPKSTLISDTYFTSRDSLSPYRDSIPGAIIEDKYSVDRGYNEQTVQEVFEIAMDDLVQSGKLERGNSLEYITHTVDILVSEEYEDKYHVVEYITNELERMFRSEKHYIQIEFNITKVPYRDIYYDYIKTREYDILFTGVSENTLCGPFQPLKTYAGGCSDDNYNIGTETDLAMIPVRYIDNDGEYRSEMWSYDAIAKAMYEETFVVEGELVDDVVAVIEEVTPTTFSFKVDNYNSQFTNFTYTVATYDMSKHEYVLVEGLVDIPFEGDQLITVDNVLNYVHEHDENWDIIYSGNYMVKISFDYNDLEISNYSVSHYQEELMDLSSLSNSESQIQLSLTYNENDYEREVTSVTIYSYTTDSYVFTVNNPTETTLSVSDLTPNSLYLITVTFDDGLMQLLSVRI